MPRGIYQRKPKTVKQGKYDLTVLMNGEVFNCKTDDLKKAIQALKPQTFKTKVIIKISNAFDSIDRVLMVRQAKLLFRNQTSQNLFIKQTLAGLKAV
jgi:hypothetical protein